MLRVTRRLRCVERERSRLGRGLALRHQILHRFVVKLALARVAAISADNMHPSLDIAVHRHIERLVGVERLLCHIKAVISFRGVVVRYFYQIGRHIFRTQRVLIVGYQQLVVIERRKRAVGRQRLVFRYDLYLCGNVSGRDSQKGFSAFFGDYFSLFCPEYAVVGDLPYVGHIRVFGNRPRIDFQLIPDIYRQLIAVKGNCLQLTVKLFYHCPSVEYGFFAYYRNRDHGNDDKYGSLYGYRGDNDAFFFAEFYCDVLNDTSPLDLVAGKVFRG